MRKKPFGEFGVTKEELSFEEAKEIAKNFDVARRVRITSSTGLDTDGAQIISSGDLYNRRVTSDVIAKATGEERVVVLLTQGMKSISYGKLKHLKFQLEDRTASVRYHGGRSWRDIQTRGV